MQDMKRKQKTKAAEKKAKKEAKKAKKVEKQKKTRKGKAPQVKYITTLNHIKSMEVNVSMRLSTFIATLYIPRLSSVPVSWVGSGTVYFIRTIMFSCPCRDSARKLRGWRRRRRKAWKRATTARTAAAALPRTALSPLAMTVMLARTEQCLPLLDRQCRVCMLLLCEHVAYCGH